MVAWPDELPDAVLQEGYAESPPQNLISQRTDIGPGMRRRRFTAAPRVVSVKIECTTEQVEIFDEFFVNDIFSGAVPFDWKHPRTGQGWSVFILNTEQSKPRYDNVVGDSWDISFDLELQPGGAITQRLLLDTGDFLLLEDGTSRLNI